MLKFFTKIQSASILATLALSFQAHAQSQITPSDVNELIMGGLLAPRAYTGFKGKIQPLPSDWLCNDRRKFWSINWQSEIKDVEVKFDAANPDFTSVHLQLDGSALKAQYYSQGGLGCLWSGAEGELKIGRIDVDFSLKAIKDKDFPEISLDGLRIQNFALQNVKVLYASVFDAGFKQSSQGFGTWVEDNLNGLIAGFLKTGLKKRLNEVINKEVDRRLKERQDSSKANAIVFIR
ncbi:MAG: hypothetical protein ABIR96_06500 [Bdellovibrionota bacterium]